MSRAGARSSPSSVHRREYERRVNRVMDHIQAHLGEELTLERLAAVAAFSPYHFHRIFAALTGETLSDFIRRIRLERAASTLSLLRDLSVLDVALHYGFSSSATFARAFKSHFGMNATEWRAGGAARWRDGLRGDRNPGKTKRNPGEAHRKDGKASARNAKHTPHIELTEAAMLVEIMELPPLRIAYMRHVGPYGAGGNIPALWTRLQRWMRAHDLFRPETQTIGIGHDAPDVVAPEKLRYDACLVVSEDFKPDHSVNVSRLPGGRYAVTSFRGTAATISGAWDRMFATWLPNSGFQPDDRPCLELYHNDSGPERDGHFRCELCLPVEPL
jgi:AraC family transcriptional regulator